MSKVMEVGEHGVFSRSTYCVPTNSAGPWGYNGDSPYFPGIYI